MLQNLVENYFKLVSPLDNWIEHCLFLKYYFYSVIFTDIHLAFGKKLVINRFDKHVKKVLITEESILGRQKELSADSLR